MGYSQKEDFVSHLVCRPTPLETVAIQVISAKIGSCPPKIKFVSGFGASVACPLQFAPM